MIMATKMSRYAVPYGSIDIRGTDQWMCGEDDHPSQSNETTNGGPPTQAMGSLRYSAFLFGCLAVTEGAKVAYQSATPVPIKVPSPFMQNATPDMPALKPYVF